MAVVSNGKTVNCVLLIVVQSLSITKTEVNLTSKTKIEIISQL